MKKQILFVDDEQPVLDGLQRMLRSQRDTWEMLFVNDPETAWERMLEVEFDVVVSDVEMPGMTGLQLLKRIRRTGRTKDVPVVIMTGSEGRELKRQALDLGAADLLSKPIECEDLLARLHSVLRLKSCQDQLRAHRDRLERTVEERTEQLSQSRLDVIWRLAKAAEHRDNGTANHVIRVGCISRVIAEALEMNRGFVETLLLAAPLHDIGKIGIPDAILMKSGRLNEKEWATMQEHCVIGQRILREESMVRSAFLQWRGAGCDEEIDAFESPFLETAAIVALTHHEKWDGTGYPQKLSGEDIPLESRIVAVANEYDAVTSRRLYKDPFTEYEALKVISNKAGGHLDPTVCVAFMDALPEIRLIKEQFADNVGVLPEPEETRNEEGLVCL